MYAPRTATYPDGMDWIARYSKESSFPTYATNHLFSSPCIDPINANSAKTPTKEGPQAKTSGAIFSLLSWLDKNQTVKNAGTKRPLILLSAARAEVRAARKSQFLPSPFSNLAILRI